MADDPRNSWMRDWRAALAAVAVIAMLGTGYALLKPRTPPEPGPDTPRPEVLALLQRELPAEYRRYVDMAQRAQGKDPVAADLMLLEFLRGVEARNGRYLTLASDDTLYRVIAHERDAAAVRQSRSRLHRSRSAAQHLRRRSGCDHD